MSGPSYHGRTHGFRLDANNKVVGYGTDPIAFPDIAIPNPTGNNIDDVILGQEPDAFWKLNEDSGVIAYDSSGNDWHLGIDTGFIGPTWAQAVGPPGEQTALFEYQTGSPRDQLSRIDSPSFPAYSSAFTAAIWVRPNDLSASSDTHYLIGQGSPVTNNGTGWQLNIQQGTTDAGMGLIQVLINDGSGLSTAHEGNNEIPIDDATWYLMAVTRSAAGLWTLFVNGLAQADTGSDAYTASTGIKIGGLNNISDPYQLDGLASYAAVWNRALTSTELLQQYNTGITGGIIADEGTVWTSDGIGGASFEQMDAANVLFTPAGTIAATDVQAAIEEVAAEAGGGGSAHVIEDEGTPLTARANLNFVGAGVTVTDSAPDTIVTIPGAGSSGWTEVVKGSDESVASSTVLQNDDALSFTTVSGKTYLIELILIYASPAGAGTPDIKVALGEDSTMRGAFATTGIGTADSATTGTLSGNQTATQLWGTAAANRAGTAYGPFVGAGGTFRLLWAQNTSGGNATIVRAGSVLRYRQVD